MGTTKITAKIHEPLWVAFNKDADSLFLKRDPFLNHIIRLETPHLKEELAGRKVSPRAKRYIAGALKSMGKGRPRQVSIVVDKETAEALNEVVDEANLVRDAFINRLLMLLRSSNQLLMYFDLPVNVDEPTLGALPAMPTSPLQAMKTVRDDPFIYLRTFAQETLDCGLHMMPMPPKLHGFSCYLEDDKVKGTAAYATQVRMLKSLLGLETSAFAEKRAKGKEQ